MTAPILLLPQLLPAAQCPTREDLDLIEGANTRIERPAKESINWVSATEHRIHIATPPLLTTGRPLETVSGQLASTDQLLDHPPSERAMAAINA